MHFYYTDDAIILIFWLSVVQENEDSATLELQSTSVRSLWWFLTPVKQLVNNFFGLDHLNLILTWINLTINNCMSNNSYMIWVIGLQCCRFLFIIFDKGRGISTLNLFGRVTNNPKLLTLWPQAISCFILDDFCFVWYWSFSLMLIKTFHSAF